MTSIIKGQIALLVTIFVAFVLTLTACGGGGSTSGGGTVQMATVSGTVTNNGVASLDSTFKARLFASLSNAFIPIGHAAGVAGVSVVLDCGEGAVYSGSTGADGRYRIEVSNVGSGMCFTSFNGTPGPEVEVKPGQTMQMDVILNGGTVKLVTLDQNPGNDSNLDMTSSNDDLSSEDDASSDDSSSDGESDDSSDADSDDSESA